MSWSRTMLTEEQTEANNCINLHNEKRITITS